MGSLRALVLCMLTAWFGCGDGAAAPPAVDTDAGSDASHAGCAACVEGVCDPASGACVPCLRASDCPSDTPVCDENTCVKCAPTDPTCNTPVDPDPPDAGGADAGTAPAALEIRFATYNVRTSNLDNGAWGDSHVGWDANDEGRMHRVADTIVAQKLTVVALEEMRRPERDAVLARLKDHHGQDWGFTTQSAGPDDCVVLFRKSVWSKLREVPFVIPLQPGLEDRSQIGALLRHDATGRVLWFYAVHFASGDGSASVAARAEAAKRTVQSIKAEAVDNEQPFVLGGDFNATSEENVGDVFRASGLMKYARSVAEVSINDGCKTFNGRAGAEGLQSCPGGVAAHIDQVWVPKSGVRVLRYQVIATQQTSRSSDHNPLTTTLKL